MGLRSPAPASPARTVIPVSTRLVASIAILATAGCNILSVHGGGPTGPTIGGTDRPGTGAPGVAQTCRVFVSNETGVILDVTYIVQSTDGATRHGNLGRIDRGDSRNTTVRCGETVTAFGRGGGRSVQGSIVARQMDDNWIRLTESASPAGQTAGAHLLSTGCANAERMTTPPCLRDPLSSRVRAPRPAPGVTRSSRPHDSRGSRVIIVCAGALPCGARATRA